MAIQNTLKWDVDNDTVDPLLQGVILHKFNTSTGSFDQDIYVNGSDGGESIEQFEILGVGYFLMVGRPLYLNESETEVEYGLNVSRLYKWNDAAGSFDLFQEFDVWGCRDSVGFNLDGDFFMVLAIAGDTNSSIPSIVYSWNPESERFEAYQTLESCVGATDVEFFAIDGDHYLTLACQMEGLTTVFRYNFLSELFEPFQSISSNGPVDVEFYKINNTFYLLAIANVGDYSTTFSQLYRWVAPGDILVNTTESKEKTFSF